MNIRIKENIMALIYSSGDIDNRIVKTPKELEDKKTKIITEINKEYGVKKEKISYKGYVEDREVVFNEMTPLVKECNTVLMVCPIEGSFEELEGCVITNALAEIKLHSYIVMKCKCIDKLESILIFESVGTKERVEEKCEFTLDEIEPFFVETILHYIRWHDLTSKWTRERNKSIKTLKFPFENFREGQEQLARGTYSTIAKNKQMFAQVPTGVGKTLATTFPAIKAIGENKIDKIFYLTAKTVGAKVCEESFDLMREQNLKFRNITITAKDKVCFKGKANCNPIACEYARNYYGKIHDVLYKLLEKEDTFTRQIIEEYAKEYRVCPYELSLDLSLYSDAIICDYNYVFDPNVYLKRYFSEDSKCNCTFLVDEAHNLVDRARSMFSSELSERMLLNVLEVCSGKYESVGEKISLVINQIRKIEDKSTNGEYSSTELPDGLVESIARLSEEANSILYRYRNNRDEVLDKISEMNISCTRFINVVGEYDESYRFFMESKDFANIKLFCIDPSNNLKIAYKRGKSSILFSATLSPMIYFRDVLGGDKDSYGISVGSPFPVDNREIIMVDNISTRYKDREKAYDLILEQINAVVSKRKGNYMVFLPSFDFMNKIEEKYKLRYPDVKTIKQDTSMTELQREIYLDEFELKPKKTMVSFNVISSIFSEGIDFKGDLLIGSIVVGVGLPMICLERDIIKNYFQKQNGLGFDFAYTYPGINRVIQAAGRVIRTDNDRGIIMLIDDRFNTQKYKQLFPREWSNYRTSKSSIETDKIVESFWKEEN